jgi:23S rRNA pseudouridine1911/1915/1917 synthase
VKPITIENSCTLLDAVMQELKLRSKTRARDVIKSGRVRLNGKIQKMPGTPVTPGTKLELGEIPISSMAKTRQTFPYPILCDDQEKFIFVKPPGIPVLAEDKGLITAFRLYKEFIASRDESIINHRVMNKIDRRESGIVIIAKTLDSALRLEKSLSNGRFKSYVVVEGLFPEGETNLKGSFAINKIGQPVPSTDPKRSEKVDLDFRLMKAGNEMSLLKIEPKSSMKNQIRALTSYKGFPIAGDKRYGALTNPLSRTCIHLFSVEWETEAGETVTFRTDVPKEFLALVKVRNRKNVASKSKK